jgi:SNF2 family DNA or RNA helicase
MTWLRTELAAAAARGSRLAIFSQFTAVLDILCAALSTPGALGAGVSRWERLDGSTPVAARQAALDAFTADAGIAVMLLSTRAGGVGVNVTAADTVVFFDCDWNPQMDLQAEDRVHRLGQTRAVAVTRVLTTGTIEMHVAGVAGGKEDVAAALLALTER